MIRFNRHIILCLSYCIIVISNVKGYSQDSLQLSIIRSITVFYDDSVTQDIQDEDIIIPYHHQKIVFQVENKDNIYYSLISGLEIDTIWIKVPGSTLTFNYLKSGSYQLFFKIGKTGKSESVQFKIRKYPVKVWKFHILYLIVIFILAYLWYLYRSWAVIKANKSYKQKEKTSIEIARQKEELSVKNKNITDSINYARRIQLAMIPSAKYFSTIFPESFIYFKPKDIVSGDFFWITEKKEKIFVAAVDCTGHGVPGAFMSIIGIELLRKLILNQGIEEPSEVLNELNKNFADIFKDVENVTLRDGMDIAFCAIDKKSRILEFAGAFNPLYLIRDNKITEIKGDRFSVGLEDYENESQNFTNHHIQLMKNDMIYIFTDGYSDQFGGPEGKKFKYRRFRHLLLTIHKLPVMEQKELLSKSMEEWMGDNDQVDDILVIGMKMNL